MRIAGAISGTSLDGIDVAICSVEPDGAGVRVACERFATVPFDEHLRARIVAAYPPARVDARVVSALHAVVGEAFGEAIARVAGETALDAVASHGVTLAHDGDAHHSLQIGDPFRIRERVRATVISDFRSADTAAGGSGAPLVPAVDRLLFGAHAPCVALNVGGIANLTVLPDGIAFDCGPANLPLDTYLALRTGGAQRYDAGGARALAGNPDSALLDELLADPYFAQPPPKSTGRERYGAAYVAALRPRLDALPLNDALATLAALTVRTVAGAVRAHAPDARLLIVAGGGVHNAALFTGLQAQLAGVRVASAAAFGVDPDAKEAIAFAVLGHETLHGRPGNVPSATGARGPRVLGTIAPFAR
ncbi:MAG TPA: anhydro-N-acetylmuramic acid kinase [Candidatus Sulfotelmatobacter sp.]|nr:anhydro-N-acetylmuramic acid kinase [Candidatus Sulfotelmatobacter sp.]